MDREQKITALLSGLSDLEKRLGAIAVELQVIRADLAGLANKREYKAVEIPPWRFPPQVRA